jgi:phosphinothricin acetyltransferase
VDHRFLRRGIGTEILKALSAHAAASGLHTLIAAISAEQEPSIKFHEKLGFSRAGRLVEVGHKFGQWLDVAYMQYMVRGIPRV